MLFQVLLNLLLLGEMVVLVTSQRPLSLVKPMDVTAAMQCLVAAVAAVAFLLMGSAGCVLTILVGTIL